MHRTVSPEAFIYIENENMLQNENGIPIFYHSYRRANDKKINCNVQQLDMRYSTSMSIKGLKLVKSTKAKKIWWLSP